MKIYECTPPRDLNLIELSGGFRPGCFYTEDEIEVVSNREDHFTPFCENPPDCSALDRPELAEVASQLKEWILSEHADRLGWTLKAGASSRADRVSARKLVRVATEVLRESALRIGMPRVPVIDGRMVRESALGLCNTICQWVSDETEESPQPDVLPEYSRPRTPAIWRRILSGDDTPFSETKWKTLKGKELRRSPDSTTKRVRLDLRDVRRFFPDYDDSMHY